MSPFGRIAPVEGVAGVESVFVSVRRTDLIPKAETGGISVLAADESLLGTLEGTLADGRNLDAATARYPTVTRLIRTISRPALHGSMAMIMVAVVILTGRSAPTYPELSDQGSVVSAMAGPIWVEVKEIADPLPRRSPIVLNRRPQRFVTLVSTEPRPWTPVPEINSPATV